MNVEGYIGNSDNTEGKLDLIYVWLIHKKIEELKVTECCLKYL